MERAAQRVALATIPRLLTRLARLDALAKGIGRGNAWDELRELALMLAGKPLPAAA
jgi:DNA polymerase-3 subunit delta